MGNEAGGGSGGGNPPDPGVVIATTRGPGSTAGAVGSPRPSLTIPTRAGGALSPGAAAGGGSKGSSTQKGALPVGSPRSQPNIFRAPVPTPPSPLQLTPAPSSAVAAASRRQAESDRQFEALGPLDQMSTEGKQWTNVEEQVRILIRDQADLIQRFHEGQYNQRLCEIESQFSTFESTILNLPEKERLLTKSFREYADTASRRVMMEQTPLLEQRSEALQSQVEALREEVGGLRESQMLLEGEVLKEAGVRQLDAAKLREFVAGEHQTLKDGHGSLAMMFDAEKAARDEHHRHILGRLGEHSGHLEAQREALSAEKAAYERRLLDEFASRDTHHASLRERLEYLEGILQDSADKHAREFASRDTHHASLHGSMVDAMARQQSEHAGHVTTLQERLEYLERRTHAQVTQEAAARETGLNDLRVMIWGEASSREQSHGAICAEYDQRFNDRHGSLTADFQKIADQLFAAVDMEKRGREEQCRSIAGLLENETREQCRSIAGLLENETRMREELDRTFRQQAATMDQRLQRLGERARSDYAQEAEGRLATFEERVMREEHDRQAVDTELQRQVEDLWSALDGHTHEERRAPGSVLAPAHVYASAPQTVAFPTSSIAPGSLQPVPLAVYSPAPGHGSPPVAVNHSPPVVMAAPPGPLASVCLGPHDNSGSFRSLPGTEPITVSAPPPPPSWSPSSVRPRSLSPPRRDNPVLVSAASLGTGFQLSGSLQTLHQEPDKRNTTQAKYQTSRGRRR